MGCGTQPLTAAIVGWSMNVHRLAWGVHLFSSNINTGNISYR